MKTTMAYKKRNNKGLLKTSYISEDISIIQYV